MNVNELPVDAERDQHAAITVEEFAQDGVVYDADGLRIIAFTFAGNGT